MKQVVAIVLFTTVQAMGETARAHEQGEMQKLLRNWDFFFVYFDKSYEFTGIELVGRDQSIFTENVHKIDDHNHRFVAGFESYDKGINQFTDFNFKEFTFMMLNTNLKIRDIVDNIQINSNSIQIIKKYDFNASQSGENRDDFNASQSFDWRKHGAVTDVKDQGYCGASWAFASVGAMEGAHFVKNEQLVSLSEQNVIDCNSEGFGCQGGNVNEALNYAIENGIDTEDNYPYEKEQYGCRYEIDDYNRHVGAKIESFTKISGPDVMCKAIEDHSPLTALVQVTDNFKNYYSGIFEDDTCKGEINHAVLIVGYGSENGKDYWIIKNSWGKSFGEKGYIKMIRGINNCKIESNAYLPISK